MQEITKNRIKVMENKMLYNNLNDLYTELKYIYYLSL